MVTTKTASLFADCLAIKQEELPGVEASLPTMHVLLSAVSVLVNLCQRLSHIMPCRLLGAEEAVLKAGGTVLRLVGLYHAGR